MDILVVDDEKSIRLTTALTLEEEGHYVETAETGSAAMSRINEEDFDLVFLDLRLGDENGMDILRKIMAVAPPRPWSPSSPPTRRSPPRSRQPSSALSIISRSLSRPISSGRFSSRRERHGRPRPRSSTSKTR